jgi:hypothetical protein
MKSIAAMIIAAALAMPACNNEIDPDIDDRVTIARGVYGQIVLGCDVVGCSDSYGKDIEVGAFATQPMPGEVLTPLASAVTDDQGFYEIALDPGTYFLQIDATSEPGFQDGTNSVEVMVQDGVSRHDFTSGPGGGFWSSP